ncbi:hypothetical protein MUK42_33563 [Musa troglodytarum]|uniref:dihydrolipoyllysine-residue succinyltransferase n=1 Tax=Musa troglodytarum TaxID=320322 RepID=A0A9E7JUB6_9LILI|nr:hypothetical protein MUK42_33563 [Musa troglodytarum]
MKKVLAFYRGKPPTGSKTDWVMHEYRLAGPESTACIFPQRKNSTHNCIVPSRDWVLCRIFKKKRATKMDVETEEGEEAPVTDSGIGFIDFMGERYRDQRHSSSSFSDSSCITDTSDGSSNGEETSQGDAPPPLEATGTPAVSQLEARETTATSRTISPTLVNKPNCTEHGSFPKHVALLIARSCRHVKRFGHQILLPGGSVCSEPAREFVRLIPRASLYQIWSRSFSSENGDLVAAVVPYMGESITDGTLATFLKKPGDRVNVDEPIAQVETDKVTIDVNSPEAGIIQEFIAKEGDTVTPGTKVAVISKSSSGDTHVAPSDDKVVKDAQPPSPPAQTRPPTTAVEKIDGQMPKGEIPAKEKPKASSPLPAKTSPSEPQLPPKERERRVPMPRLRKRVATRLKDSQNTFALLTTFNEVDMTNLMKLRSEYKDAFAEKHGVKMGLMSGFVKAAVSGLQNQPIINAVIDGDDIIYRDYIDISIAVGTPKGLVVPVIRNADGLNFAEIEKEINTLAKKANNGTISIDEMAGGTFTISNGGVYGSLLSTPIINPPQSAILGMHSIVSRPMVVDGNIVPRPMMYIALTYDHRLIDGREAVFFLRRIKDVVEDPRRLLLDL